MRRNTLSYYNPILLDSYGERMRDAHSSSCFMNWYLVRLAYCYQVCSIVFPTGSLGNKMMEDRRLSAPRNNAAPFIAILVTGFEHQSLFTRVLLVLFVLLANEHGACMCPA